MKPKPPSFAISLFGVGWRNLADLDCRASMKRQRASRACEVSRLFLFCFLNPHVVEDPGLVWCLIPGQLAHRRALG